MKGWPMYQKLQQLKEMGLNKSQVQRQLGIDWKTVDRYWGVTPDEFAEIRTSPKRSRKHEKYEGQIVRWLKEHPDMSSAQIQDWLKQHYSDYQGKERTLRRFVSDIRSKYNIEKCFTQHQYLVLLLPYDVPRQTAYVVRKLTDMLSASPPHHGLFP